jgi:hypothetical protein
LPERYDHRWRERYPGAWAVVLAEGASVFAVLDEVGYWLITDSGTLPHEDEDLLDAMVDVQRFEDERAWRAAIERMQEEQPKAARLAGEWNEAAGT